MKGESAEGDGQVLLRAGGQGRWGDSERGCPGGLMFIPCPSPSQILGDPKQTRPAPASHPGELSSPGVAHGGTFSGLCGAVRPGTHLLGARCGPSRTAALQRCVPGLYLWPPPRGRGVAASLVLGRGGQEHPRPPHCEDERTDSSTDRSGVFFF